MMRTVLWTAPVGLVLLLAIGVPRAAADDHCFYRGSMYSDGASSCQNGVQYRCDDGDWKDLDVGCTQEEMKTTRASRSCAYQGVSYSTGSASCQSGTQYRCEDGTWTSLRIDCSIGDEPITVKPEGRTCMFGGATVAHNSTICRDGTTFLCNDGDWKNLGTECR